MKEYRDIDLIRNLDMVLKAVETIGKIILRRDDGATFAITLEQPNSSPLNIPSIQSKISTNEIVEIVRSGREGRYVRS